MRHGTYTTIDGRPALVFERRLAHPIASVWAAVTDPLELVSWFPARMEHDGLRPGARVRFVFPDGGVEPSEGEVLEVDPPHRFAFTWEQDELRLDLREDGDGCVVVLTNLLGGDYPAASVAAGWHVCLDALEARLAGEPAAAPGTEPTPGHERLQAEYAARGLPAGSSGVERSATSAE